MSWFPRPEIQALAGTLLHSLWEGAAVALALALVLSSVRNCRLRYAASGVAMLVLLGGLVVTFTHLVPPPPAQSSVSVPRGHASAATRSSHDEISAVSVMGLTRYYARTASIYRNEEQGVRHELAVPLKDIMHRKAQDVPLMAGDILMIPDESGMKQQPPQFYDPPPPAPPREAPRSK